MRLLSFPELKSVKGIRYTRQHIARMEKTRRFPMHVKLGVGPNSANAWTEPEVDAYIQSLVDERDAGADAA
jgi:predicted DNA-binding transcriptional regulator AlpA